MNHIMAMMGGQNVHFDINFADGLVWIARIRLKNDPTLPPDPVQEYIFLSEVAIMEFLKTTAVPSPDIHHYQKDSKSNPVGVSFILMDKLPGKPLNLNLANSFQRRHLLEQLADIYLELERHPFEKMGSPVNHKSVSVDIGPYAQVPLFESPERSLGPFTTLKTAYTTILHQQMNLLTSGEVTDLSVENYLSLCWRLEALPLLLSSHLSANHQFYLKHYDDKGDHILVDEEYNITGMIDWEFASTEAKEVAFSSPCMLWPVGKFYDGSNQLSDDELLLARIYADKGRNDLADIVLNGRKMQRYLFFNGGGMPSRREEFDSLQIGLLEAFAEPDDPDGLSKLKTGALARFSKDTALLENSVRQELKADAEAVEVSVVLKKRADHWASLSSITATE